MIANFANQIQSEYYGENRFVSIEGIALEHFSAAPKEDIKSSTTQLMMLLVCTVGHCRLKGDVTKLMCLLCCYQHFACFRVTIDFFCP